MHLMGLQMHWLGSIWQSFVGGFRTLIFLRLNHPLKKKKSLIELHACYINALLYVDLKIESIQWIHWRWFGI